MASTAVASIEKVAGWAKVSTVEDGPLDGAVTDQDLRDVCGFMVQWQSLAERLGVGEAALEEVKEDGPDARRIIMVAIGYAVGQLLHASVACYKLYHVCWS